MSMITFNDIETVMKTNRFDELALSYEARQKENEHLNIAKVLELNQITSTPFFDVQKHKNPIRCFIIYLATVFNSPFLEKKHALEQLLKEYRYQSSFELIQAMRFIDLANTQDLSIDLFSFLLGSLFTIESVNESLDNLSLYLADGSSYPIFNASQQLKIEEVPSSVRRNYCHDMTTQYLMQFPDLYGFYYYVPFQLAGNFEHSVLVDPNEGIVYDLAQNLALPLKVWKMYYPVETFSIQGHDFQDLRNKTFEKYEYKIDLSFLEEVRRIRKK
ncbi:MAG: hypothetical protein K2M17_02560 [Bacilli bacterium]|nr:hypothetical protein [Bacilli bacterium]